MQILEQYNNSIMVPNLLFWENDLELPIKCLIDDYSNLSTRQIWLKSLSIQQITILYIIIYTVNIAEFKKRSLSLTQMQNALLDQLDDLFNYYLVTHLTHSWKISAKS